MSILSDEKFAEKIFEIACNPVKEFKPFCFNNTEGDCVEFFVSSNDYYADRIDDYLTLYLDMDTDELVGFVVKNVKRIIDKISDSKLSMMFVVDDGKVQLRSLFTALFNDKPTSKEQETIVRYYQKVVKEAESNDIDIFDLACV